MTENTNTENEGAGGPAALSAGLGALPCPFCGKAETVEVVDSDTFSNLLPWDDDALGNPLYWAVICSAGHPDGKGGCGASGGFYMTKDEAIRRWNIRTPNTKDQADAA